MNIVKNEFINLMEAMFKDTKISDGQKTDMERTFYAGAIATHMAILQCSESKDSERDLEELFDFIYEKGSQLIGEKNV